MDNQEKVENKQPGLGSTALWYMANVFLEEELYDRATEKTQGMTLSEDIESCSILD